MSELAPAEMSVSLSVSAATGTLLRRQRTAVSVMRLGAAALRRTMFIEVQPTPNENTLKFVPGVQVRVLEADEGQRRSEMPVVHLCA